MVAQGPKPIGPMTRMVRRMDELGAEIVPAATNTPEALQSWLKQEIDKWGPVIRAGGKFADRRTVVPAQDFPGSSPRRRGPRASRTPWIPAPAGMTWVGHRGSPT